jgi:hypothetical protein
MACSPLMIWRPVPDKSIFQVRVTGDTNLFDVQMDASCAGQPSKTFDQSDLVPGPAAVTMNAGDHCTFDIVLNVFQKPTAAQPVIIEVRVVDANGNIVQVADGAGGSRNAQCASQFTEVTGNTPASIVAVVIA